MSVAASRLAACTTDATRALLGAEPDATGLHARVLDAVEGPLIAAVLSHTGGNRSQAARALGLTRSTLRRKLTKHGLEDA